VTSRRPPTDPDRRRFLAGGCRLAAASLCLPLAPLLGGCNPEDETPAPLRIALDDLPLDTRVRLEHDGRAVELLRTAEGVTARSLLCTHQGCNVQWLVDREIYLCPCHDGQFDAAGNPIYGPPREPLRTLPVRLEAGAVVVDD
jgi:cytochrome b6-f complex iron-sulfur subunit